MDLTLYRIHREVDEFRAQSFDKYQLEIFILPSDDAAKIFDNRGSWMGYNRYYFDAYSRDLRPKSVRLVEGRIQIWHRGMWRSLASFLKHFKTSRLSNAPLNETRKETQERLNEIQRKWWSSNGKTFKLMDLPSEVRELVYAHAFGGQVVPYPTSKTRIPAKSKLFFLARTPNAGLLRTSRLVYEEASNILFKYTPFFVDRLGILSRLLKNKEQSSRIRHLVLAMNHYEFLQLFGLHTGSSRLYDPRSAAYALEGLELARLEIRFGAPPESPLDEWLDYGCQKKVVDWILEAAFPFIRKHPVELTGYIKNSSRALFEIQKSEERERVNLWQKGRLASGSRKGTLREYYDWLDEEDGGVYLEQGKADEEWAKGEIEKDIPPTCRCKIRCSARHWNPKG